MIDVISGDTVNISRCNFTILTYVDSAGCTGCRMNLPLWREFMNTVDSVAGDAEVDIIMVVNTTDKSELRFLARRDSYCNPIVMDAQDSLNIINGFPSGSDVRTFLLDRDHRVLAIGNPVANSAVANLFRAIISGSKTFSDSGKSIITALPSSVDFGQIKAGKTVSISLQLSNSGSDSIFIREIIPSCPCITVAETDSVITPNGAASLALTLKSNQEVGDFNGTVNVFYHNCKSPTVIPIRVTVVN